MYVLGNMALYKPIKCITQFIITLNIALPKAKMTNTGHLILSIYDSHIHHIGQISSTLFPTTDSISAN